MAGFFEPHTYGSLLNVSPWQGPDAQFGPPQVEMFHGGYPETFVCDLNRFLAAPDVAILGISPAAVSTCESDQMMVVTVVYQQRLAPNGGDDWEAPR